MADLIDRQAAIDALEWKWAGKVAIDAIKNLPSVKRKKGTWVAVENPNYSPFDCSSEKISVCSVCGYAREQHDFNYCPNCGADMREENTDER